MKRNKIFIILLLFLVPTISYAVFQDIEKSTGNTFSADTLNISFNTVDSTGITLVSDVEYTVNTTLRNLGNLPNTNTQKYEFVSGDQGFADLIDLTVKVGGVTQYTGKLSSYTLSSTSLATGESLNIQYIFKTSTLDSSQTINFRIKNIANQVGLTYPAGFNDIETISFSLTYERPITRTSSPLEINTSPTVDIIDLLLEESKLTEDVNEEAI